MRRILSASLLLFLLILPVFAQEDLTQLGGSEAMKEEVRTDIIGMLTSLFGPWTTFKIEGAKGPVGLFSAEFLAAFFIVYFLIGSASSFQLTQGPAQFVGGGLPKILIALIFTLMMWNTFGGMRYERFLILMVPPMLVYYILSNVLTNFALISGRLAQLIAIAAAAIAFLFYSPQFIEYIEGRFRYGVLDNLALSGGVFFAVYIFGFFLTKLTNEVVGPLRTNEAATRRSLQHQIDQLPPDEKKRVSETMGILGEVTRRV